MMKKVIKYVLVIVILITLTACSSKKGVDSKQFESIMRSENFYVSNVTSEVMAENMKNAIFASNNKYQIEYYEFASKNDGELAFKSNKNIIDNSKSEKSKTKEITINNYNFYSIDTEDKYMCVSRSGSRLVYVYANIEYKKDIKKILSKLNF